VDIANNSWNFILKQHNHMSSPSPKQIILTSVSATIVTLSYHAMATNPTADVGDQGLTLSSVIM
jgi:hypothetical protein